MKFFSMFFSCNQTIQLNPKLSEAWDNKGFILNNLGKYQESTGGVKHIIIIIITFYSMFFSFNQAI